MRHMWLCFLAICQFAIFPQAHFEPVEQFQPIWQKAKGLRHTNFCIFHQKLYLKEEKVPAYCCIHVASEAAGTSRGTLPPTRSDKQGVWRAGCRPRRGDELNLRANPSEAVLPQQCFASADVILLQWRPQASAKNQAIFTEGYFVLWGLFFFFSNSLTTQDKNRGMGHISGRNGKKTRDGVTISYPCTGNEHRWLWRPEVQNSQTQEFPSYHLWLRSINTGDSELFNRTWKSYNHLWLLHASFPGENFGTSIVALSKY